LDSGGISKGAAMKKLLIFFIVFALAAAAANAQIELNKRLIVGTSLVNGSTLKDKDSQQGVAANIQRLEYYIAIEGKTEDNTFGFGGEFQRRPGDEQKIYAWAWWQPSPELVVALGDITNWQVPLGRASGDITGWNLIGEDAYHMDDNPFWEGGGYAGSVLKNMHGFYQGVAYTTTSAQGQNAGAISIRPLPWLGIDTPDKLNLILAFPTLAGDSTGGISDDVKTVYLDRIEAQLVYDIDGVGQAAFAFKNSMREAGMVISMPNKPTDPPIYDVMHWYDDSKGLFAQWRMNLPYKMAFEAGLNYTLSPPKNKIKSKWPVDAGLGWIMGDRANDTLVLSSRIGLQIPMEKFQNFIAGWDVSAEIRIFKGTKLYMPMGVSVIFPSNGPTGQYIIAGKGQAPVFYWALSPYVVQDLGGPKIHLCLRIHNGQDVGWPELGPNAPHNGEIFGNLAEFLQRGSVIKWNIPIYLAWSF